MKMPFIRKEHLFGNWEQAEGIGVIRKKVFALAWSIMWILRMEIDDGWWQESITELIEMVLLFQF